MTLDEAIKHAEEVAEEKEAQAWEAQLQEEYEKIKSCRKCAEEHRQLAEWFKDYKQLKEQQSNEDCVSRQAMLKEIPRLWNSRGDKDYCMETLRDFVTELPPVTPTRKKGKWIRHYCNNGNLHHIECSNCHDWHENFLEHKYCPNCGAEMESEE